MNSVLRSVGNATLAETCARAILDPNIAFGIVSAEYTPDASPEDIAIELALDQVSTSLDQAWHEAGNGGNVQPLRYISSTFQAPNTHIDARRVFTTKDPARLLVLSVPRYGRARVFGQVLDNILSSDPDEYYSALTDMQLRAKELNRDSMPVRVDHETGEVLVIPALPRPTAHAVVAEGARLTNIWNSFVTLQARTD